MNKKIILGALFFIHFFMLIIFSLKQITVLSLGSENYLAQSMDIKHVQKIDNYLTYFLPQKKNSSFGKDCLNVYMKLAGSKTSFIYFVTHISPVAKIVFELEFNDGTHQVVLPTCSSNEMGIRIRGMADIISQTSNEAYRDLLIQRITEHEIASYSNVKSVRVILGTIDVPALSNFTKSPNLDFKYLYQYNFRIK